MCRIYLGFGRVWPRYAPDGRLSQTSQRHHSRPGLYRQVRKKLSQDQREAAEIFGGGINAFSRYANGKTSPPLALVKLFKVLDRHPDLLGEVRAA